MEIRYISKGMLEQQRSNYNITSTMFGQVLSGKRFPAIIIIIFSCPNHQRGRTHHHLVLVHAPIRLGQDQDGQIVLRSRLHLSTLYSSETE